MKIPALLTAGVLALATVGCARSTPDRHFPARDLAEVARVLEGDSSLHARPGALYQVGLAYALPNSPLYDPERAVALFDRLQMQHPGHAQWEHVSQLQELLRHVNLQHERQLSRDARLRAQQTELDDLKAQLAREKTRADRLDRELRERDVRLRALQEELDALKQIDLNRSPPAAAAPSDRPRPPNP